MSRTAPTTPENLWLPLRRTRTSSPRIRLFCFPFAGGAASVYRTWPEAYPQDVEVLPVQLPGREKRMREAPFKHLDELLDAMVPILRPHLDKPFALFGHSMGAIIAYGVARRLIESGAPKPAHLFVSARAAPHRVAREEPIHSMPGPQFVEALKKMGGTPPQVLEHKELMELVEPLLRADLQLNEGYVHRESSPLPCPLTAFCGAQDQEAEEEPMRAWEDMTAGTFRFHLFPQGHFFIDEARDELIQEIVGDLAQH